MIINIEAIAGYNYYIHIIIFLIYICRYQYLTNVLVQHQIVKIGSNLILTRNLKKNNVYN